jgi:GTP 3',8-cyclase
MGVQIEGHKLMYHPERVAAWKNNELVHPIYVEIGPINSCNHKCVFCALDYLKNKGAMLSIEVLKENLIDMASFGVKSVMFAGEGEPLLYPHIIEAVKTAAMVNLDIAITTNGVLFDNVKREEIIPRSSWIKFSIDAGSSKSYNELHKGGEKDYRKVLDNIAAAVILRNRQQYECKLGAQMLMLAENKNEVESFIQDVKRTGIDYAVLKPYSQHPDSINQMDGHISVEEDKRLNAIVKKYSTDKFKVIYRDDTYREIEKSITYNMCHGINFFCLITATGDVIPCNIFYENPFYTYGNINKKLFSNIWLSGKRVDKMFAIQKKGCKDCRKGCRLNYANKYLDDIYNNSIEHVNFI